jgi:predicted PurR-regulated permease PerM
LALLLGVIAGLFNFIPNFGPLFTLVPATVLALAGENPQSALWVIVMFLVIQNLEGNLLTPMVQRRAVELPPAMGIIAQILLGILTGFLGLILAWPLAAAVHVAVKMLYVEDVLGDRIGSPGDNGDVKEVQQATDMAEQTIEDGERRRAEDDTARTAKPNS